MQISAEPKSVENSPSADVLHWLSDAIGFRRQYQAWIRQFRHRRELDALLLQGDPMFRDMDVTRDEVLRERNRPLSDFL